MSLLPNILPLLYKTDENYFVGYLITQTIDLIILNI